MAQTAVTERWDEHVAARRAADPDRSLEFEFDSYLEPAYERYRAQSPVRPQRPRRSERDPFGARAEARARWAGREAYAQARAERPRLAERGDRAAPQERIAERSRGAGRERDARAAVERPRRTAPARTVDEELVLLATPSAAQARTSTTARPSVPLPGPGAGVPGRRTVTIRGQGAERHRLESSRRPHERRHEREGFRPDRAALWAVLLGLTLMLVAVTSAHAAMF